MKVMCYCYDVMVMIRIAVNIMLKMIVVGSEEGKLRFCLGTWL